MTLSIILNVVLFISNIVVFFIQRTTIKHLRIRLAELERTNKASLELSEGTGKSFEAYKSMLKVDDIQKHIDRQVELQLASEVDKVIADVAVSMATDAKLLERSVELISADLYKFCQSSLNFVVFIYYQLNFTEGAIKAAAKSFFPENPKVADIMLEEYVRLKIRYPNGIPEPAKQTAQKID